MDSVPATGVTVLECGQPFRPPPAAGLTLTGRFPPTAPAETPMVTGTVQVTSRDAIRGVVSPRAEVFLVRDGRVATVPLAQDAMGIRWELAPGASRSLPGEATLVSCAAGGGRLAPGVYELYARVVLTPDDGGPGVESVGGPWPLAVR